MARKLALAAGSGAAALTLALALAAAGFAPAPATSAGSLATTVDQAPEPTVLVDTIYVAPPAKQETITVHKVVRTSGEGSEGEHERESGDDD